MEAKEIEDLFYTRGRARILKILTEEVELNISEVGRSAGMNYSNVNRHLTALNKAGLVREKRFGAIRIFELAFRSFHISFVKGEGLKAEVE